MTTFSPFLAARPDPLASAVAVVFWLLVIWGISALWRYLRRPKP